VADWLNSTESKQLRTSIDWHLSNVSDDRSLRDRLEGMATSELFKAHAWYWAPRLYARNRALFRPFIHQYFAEHYVSSLKTGATHPVEWKGEVASALDRWLVALERDGDVPFFRRLYAWKHRDPRGWGVQKQRFCLDVNQRFAAASTPAQRAKVLDQFDLSADLDEPAAIRLFETDARLAGPFILKHLPSRWTTLGTKEPEPWRQLADAAKRAGNDDFYFSLYRRQVKTEDWSRDSLQLCKTIREADALNDALEKRHPQSGWDSLGLQFHKLLKERGRDVLPYVRKHLRQVFAWGRKNGYKELVDLARHRGWVDVWAAIVVTCGTSDNYNDAFLSVIDDPRLEEPERLRRLLLLSGVSSEWNGIGWGVARVQQLSERNALSLYKRYPHLLRQTFKAHVTPAWRDDHFELFELAWSKGDDEVADYLASRYATRAWVSGKTKAGIGEIVAEKYLALKLDDDAFARRAANVLTLIPAYSIYNYNDLIRKNRLARLLFERSLKSFLGVPAAVRDLVEGGEIHVQMLAYRVLGLADSRAEEQARENLDILIGTLLRPLHRRTRMAAFGALLSAASDLPSARFVLAKARAAFALPDKRYPKEQLVGLIGKILARFPELAGPTEQRVVYRRAS
jgi:hypothetical protein